MPEYVYALHDFEPEHEDEVPFRAGERIEVVEKDELYGDGWWQGRNLAGKVGLFPMSYTAPVPPATVGPVVSLDDEVSPPKPAHPQSDGHQSASASQHQLHTLPEESEPESAPSPLGVTSPAPAIQLNGYSHDVHDTSTEGGVMGATMTDVQKAIEQLGLHRRETDDGDGERSFSFASTGEGDDRSYRYHDGDNTEGETDDTEFDDGGEGWHKGARRKLAEKARRAVEEAEKLEMILSDDSKGKGRLIVPPIEVEMSDESDDDDDGHGHGTEGDYTIHSMRDHPHIPEDSEESDGFGDEFGRRRKSSDGQVDAVGDTAYFGPSVSDTINTSASTISTAKLSTSTPQSIDISLQTPSHDEDGLITATRTTFQNEHDKLQETHSTHPNPVNLSLPTPVSPITHVKSTTPRMHAPATSSEHIDHSLPGGTAEERTSSPVIPYRESLIALPSPTASSVGFSGSRLSSKHSSVTAEASHGPSSPVPPTGPTQVQPTVRTTAETKREKVHPTEWSVEDVVEWLKSRGFDQDVCDKFTEQEITGDVLLELDANLLKTEIGIMAFGKRVRIANAITELRRPPSIVYSDHQPSPSSPYHPHSPVHSPNFQSPNLNPHSPAMSSPNALHNVHMGGGSGLASPASITPSYQQTHSRNVSYGYTQSLQSSAHQSLNSPVTFGFGTGVGAGSEVGSVGGEDVGNEDGRVKNRPAHLNLSPSDSALTSAKAAETDTREDTDDKAAISEGEAAPTSGSIRRRFFGGSARNSSSSIKDSKGDRNSRDGTASPLLGSVSPTIAEKDKDKDSAREKDSASISSGRHARNKKSMDSKPHDRLSLFGGTFSGTLGKHRKPPPRYSAAITDDITSEKGSHLSLSRLYGGSSKKNAKSDVVSPKGSPKEKVKVRENLSSKEHINPSLLRKRTVSGPSAKSPDLTGSLSSPTGPNGNGSENGDGNGVNGSPLRVGQNILEQIGDPDHGGWMRKKSDRYNTWKTRYFVLKGPHMYCLKSNSKTETKIKGYINIIGYKVTVDENIDPGRYGFRIDHDNDRTHYFSSEEKTIIRDWMKAIMKATIGRDYTKPVVSSCNIPTIPLTVAQAMNPAPRPPSPTARDATQKALRRENPHQLSSRDARVLMGLPSNNDTKEERTRLDSFFSETIDPTGDGTAETTRTVNVKAAPPRPSREARRVSSQISNSTPVDDGLVEWANSHLPASLQITDPTGSLCGGLALLRLAESIKGHPSSPPVLDSAFPRDASDDKLDGLFRLFDFLLDNDVKMGSVSINDVRQGKREKIVQLLRALKSWEDKRKAIAQSIGKGSVQAGGFIAPVGLTWTGI